MAKGTKVYEVEALMWVRGKIPGKTHRAAIESLLDCMRAEEEKLAKLTKNDYDVSITGSAEMFGGLTNDDFEGLRRRPWVSELREEVEDEGKAPR